MELSIEDQILQASLGDNEQTEKPLTLNINGQSLTFNSTQDLQEKLSQALGTVNSEVTTLKQQLAEYQAKINTPTGQYVTSDDDDARTDKFNVDTFIEKMRQNPIDGFDYVDQYRKNPYKNKLDELEGFKQEYEAKKFMEAHPEFPGGNYGNILNATREELGLPFNKIGLEAALAHAQQSQRIPDFKLQMALQSQQQQFLQYLQANNIQLPNAPQSNNVAPPQQYVQSGGYNPNQGGIPTVPRNQPQPNNDVLRLAEDMPLEKLEELLRKNGMI